MIGDAGENVGESGLRIDDGTGLVLVYRGHDPLRSIQNGPKESRLQSQRGPTVTAEPLGLTSHRF